MLNFLFAGLLSLSTLVSTSPGLDDAALNSDCECSNEHIIKNTHNLEGYLDKRSYAPGETAVLYGHTLSRRMKVSLVKLGLTEQVLLVVNRVCTMKQDYSSCAFKKGCHWSPSLYMKLSDNLQSGYYAMKMESGGYEFYVPFIIRPKSGTEQSIVVVASTNTWQAYNDWGGASFYSFSNDNPCGLRYAKQVSFLRPYANLKLSHEQTEHTLNAEMNLFNWLSYNDYKFDVISDDDLHKDTSILSHYKVLILTPHPEYWTKEMYANLERHIEAGHDLMYLGGNGVYWKTTNNYDQLECRKDSSMHEQTGERGGKWRDLGKPESAVLGVQYDNRGIGTYSPYQVQNASHWVYNGTGVSNGQEFAYPNYFNIAGSGHETDKMTSFSPTGTILLAKGMNPASAGSSANLGGADMVYYESASGAKVFSAGSISFCSTLLNDDIVSSITKNVLDRFIAP